VACALPCRRLAEHEHGLHLLPFTNVLVEMDLTGSEVIAALEDGVANHLDAAVPSDGSHPYAAGLRWDLDMSKAKGQRFSNVQAQQDHRRLDRHRPRQDLCAGHQRLRGRGW
jgi:2',3'-cyclic-nucleotide 2'-phosphodiesterase (5'-nucleotidase family)